MNPPLAVNRKWCVVLFLIEAQRHGASFLHPGFFLYLRKMFLMRHPRRH
jgi:hypothetical protein